MRKILLAGCTLLLVFALAGFWLSGTGFWGERQSGGEFTNTPRSSEFVADKTRRLAEGAAQLEGEETEVVKQILFGDLHAHTTYSLDAYSVSLPMYQGEGAHPPGDACDFARYCSALDFWSINDHAEGLTPKQWSQTRDIVRDCNRTAGDPKNPDMVTFLGWEWTQIGNTPSEHYGHKNIILKDTADDKVPARPISSREELFPGGGNPYTLPMRLLFMANGKGSDGRQPYHDFNRYLEDRDQLGDCPRNVPVRELPTDCQESAPTPTELFAKLDDWGFPYMVIPHGNTWGFYTPPMTSWDKQLKAHDTPDKHEPLIEIFSGHGNIEQYKPWRAVQLDKDGNAYCPEPSDGFLPECWQAGEIIRGRCLATGSSEPECDRRAIATRANFILTKDSGHWTVPGSNVEDWLNAGQCPDCYMPAYNHRPASSVQYGLAIRDFSDPEQPPKRFRWGIIGSSDVHTARPGTGYKEIMRRNMTDASLGLLGPPKSFSNRDPEPNSIMLEETGGLAGPYFERFASFFGTGGLVAVHSSGRDRDAIWDALARKEVYGTSGDRILLWFDLMADNDAVIPMGSSISRTDTPEFQVSALGAFEQKPGCPEDAINAVQPERLQRLCGGECYHPSDLRKRIDRIEVVRIRPQISAEEQVDNLIEDPWLTLPCPAGKSGCKVSFTDPDYAEGKRDAVYYVRAIEEASPTVNGDQLRCEKDEFGQCLAVKPCGASEPTQFGDDCLATVEERAWSSPIFVDFEQAL
ncbi:MAG: DUF3604 domain-containing protein [Halioglobus sp.]